MTTRFLPIIKFVELYKDNGIRIQSLKTGKLYILQLDSRTKKWKCSCPHHIFKRVTCKHLTSFLRGDLDDSLDL